MPGKGLGRDSVHEAAWGDSERYPHPLVSCLMPLIALLAMAALGLFALEFWRSTLPRDTVIPSVTGLMQEPATDELARAGLRVKVGQTTRPSETIPTGGVVATEPVAGRRVKVGRTVTLILSEGSNYTVVPDIRELPQAEALQRLRKAGLSPTAEEYVTDDKIPADRVISVTPAPGTKVQRRSSIALVISSGKTKASRADIRSSTITVDLPTDFGEPQLARIDITDRDGTRTVFQQYRAPGEQLVNTVQGYGETTVQVYYANRLILTRKL